VAKDMGEEVGFGSFGISNNLKLLGFGKEFRNGASSI
jgi:hypothetical protein